MTAFNPKQYYTRFLKGHEGKLHFAAHSHHFWPDITREAQLTYWDDCASLSDEKWNKVFGEVLPETQKNIARILNLKNHRQIALAPNTHELAARLLSCFQGNDSLSILTTSSEFHSLKRQLLRLSEERGVHLQMVSTHHLLHDKRKFLDELKTELHKGPDLFFISQVFFDSGLALTVKDLQELHHHKVEQTIMVVDGYHGFAALPTDLAELEGKIFYLGGGYKYAQGGEGIGFMIIPQGEWRPANTGWFAEFSELSFSSHAKVGYSSDYLAFMGATQDPSGWYRFNAVWKQFQNDGLGVEKIHAYVVELQRTFIAGLPENFLKIWGLKALVPNELHYHGHFLTFEAAQPEMAQDCQETLKKSGILIDRRGSRLRFGFGLYHDLADVHQLLAVLKSLEKSQ